MKKYKLVRPGIKTGDALKAELLNENFELVQVPEVNLMPLPERPTSTPGTSVAGIDEWNLYDIAKKAAKAHNALQLAQVRAARALLVQQLSENFLIATWGKTGHDLPDGRPEVGLFIEDKPGYKFANFALVLEKKTDVLNFICYKFNND